MNAITYSAIFNKTTGKLETYDYQLRLAKSACEFRLIMRLIATWQQRVPSASTI
jgi:hypothetical protein